MKLFLKAAFFFFSLFMATNYPHFRAEFLSCLKCFKCKPVQLGPWNVPKPEPGFVEEMTQEHFCPHIWSLITSRDPCQGARVPFVWLSEIL